jgi:uncharacterized protein (UPF0335 family)
MSAGSGHNSAPEVLAGIVSQLEEIADQKRDLTEQAKVVMAEAKGQGFDPKIIRIVLRRRQMTADDRAEQDELVETYENNLG